MKFRCLKNKNKSKAHQLLRYFFPILSLLTIWKIWHKSKFFEVNKKKKLLGIAVISFFVFWGQKSVLLEFLVVNPAKHRGGIGSLLLERIENHARKKKQRFIFLFSAPWRKSAHSFYQKHGYHKSCGFFFWKRL